MKRLSLLALLGIPLFAGTVRTSVQTGNMSDAATWGGTAPVTGDYIVVSSGTTVTGDETITLSNNAGCTAAAVTINGAAGNPGVLTINNGVTLTLDSCSSFGSMNVAQYGQFTPSPGATILFNPGGGSGLGATNNGTISAIGTALLPITFSGPASNYSWNTSHTHPFTGDVLSPWSAFVWEISLGSTWVSNAAHTGPGSLGDSSLAFSLLSGQLVGCFTNEVATVDLIANTGDFAVNYDNGVVFFYNTVTLVNGDHVTVTWKSLQVNRTWTIAASSTGSFTCQFCVIDYGGSASVSAIALGGSGSVTHSAFNWNYADLWLDGTTGTLGSPILIQNNQFNSTYVDLGGTVSAVYLVSSTAYVVVDGNVFNTSVGVQSTGVAANTITHTGLRITNNSGWASGLFLQNSYNGANIAPGGLIQGNVLRGFTDATSASFRMITGFSGSAVNGSLIQNNTFSNNSQGVSVSSYTTVQNNVFAWMTNDFVRICGLPGQMAKNSVVKNNLFIGASPKIGNGMMTGSETHPRDIENLELSHNTFAADTVSGQGGWSFGYVQPDLIAGLKVHDNLIYDLNAGSNRQVSTSTYRIAGGMARNDTNYYYGMSAGNVYLSYNQGASFLLNGSLYAAGATRNVTGVSLWNPSYSTAQTGRSLVFTVTSPGNKTLAWTGGTPVQIVAGLFGNGQVNTFNAATATTLTVNGAPWSTDQTNAACPTSMWAVVVSGTDAGDIVPISSNTTGQITVKAWAVIPDATSLFAIIVPEVTLYDSGATNYVTAGIDARYLPATSQTDSGISIQLTDVYGVNPRFLGGSSRTSMVMSAYTPLNPALWCAGSDGETVGAVAFCGTGKALLAAAEGIIP